MLHLAVIKYNIQEELAKTFTRMQNHKESKDNNDKEKL